MMKAKDCPSYDGCQAAICPLDTSRAQWFVDEPICALPDITKRYPWIRRQHEIRKAVPKDADVGFFTVRMLKATKRAYPEIRGIDDARDEAAWIDGISGISKPRRGRPAKQPGQMAFKPKESKSQRTVKDPASKPTIPKKQIKKAVQSVFKERRGPVRPVEEPIDPPKEDKAKGEPLDGIWVTTVNPVLVRPTLTAEELALLAKAQQAKDEQDWYDRCHTEAIELTKICLADMPGHSTSAGKMSEVASDVFTRILEMLLGR